MPIGSAKDDKKINELNEDPKKRKLKKRVVKETLKEEDTAKVPAKQEVTEQSTKKRKSGHVKMIAIKRPRLQPDADSDDKHRKCLRIVTFKGTIDSEIMETKSFVSRLHKVSTPDGEYLVIYKVNGHFRAFNYLMEQYSKITSEGIELILWGDLKIMMESSTEENDQGLEVKEESNVVLHLGYQLTLLYSKELASPGSNSSWLKSCFKNFHELEYEVLIKLQECWWEVNAHEIALFPHMKNFGHGPYANIKTEWGNNPHLDTNHISKRNHETSNIGCSQEDQEHKDDPIPEPSKCKVRKFEMMKYLFNDEEEYITIKESEHLNHSKNSLDAYRELLHLTNEGWVVTTPIE
ncbi:hypothetical protein Tco_0992754 [Tanacetum coccineum]|uniref:Uncharacterized protein n=1 Tax=Tanacetum coccineum TaxID=301880 RepID=A0ABQ5F380_9ASTR